MLSFKMYVINLLLLLLLTGQLLTDSALRTSKIDFINNIIAKVQNERPVETLLFMKRRKDINCLLQEISPVGLATLRLDERTVVNVKRLFNSEALALACMSKLSDSQLLTTVAQNLDRMREARIVILSQITPSNLEEFLRIVSEQANEYNLVNLIVLYSTSYDVNGSITAYRLQPFPSPIFERVLDINDGPIFPKVWLNFHGRTAVILPDLFPPRSMLITNPRTGEQKLLLNLRALAGVMGLPMTFRRYRTSISLQQIIMVMSIFSLVLSSYFNANLSTLLTKHPQFKQIQNFEELRRSGLTMYVINLLLLLLLTGQLLTDPALRTSKIDFINYIIAKVQNERPVETLLFMKRRKDINCLLQEISPVGLATLRLDERTVVNVKRLFNSEALALACMSELADSQLLTTVAQNLDRMREARIVILSQITPSNLDEFLRIVSEQANEYNLVNLIVLHSTSYDFDGSITAYRLQPFPSPIFESVLDINDGPIFPKVCVKSTRFGWRYGTPDALQTT
ncbi:uncharacterized protein LOC115761489 [Drosophila novamexicana]|uniref:uncharacterized protein LOC115761489 n=1 Tax=Drosophila novamexicana TaxID=47314 RepID=UPI0011E60564|nr:uncharacterized protein LOC115761489 [Drosophila novamexicana]